MSAPVESLHIVQIAPDVAPGSGVAGVAYEIERALMASGAQVSRFTRHEAGLGAAHPSRSRLGHAWDVVLFSTVGTRRARAFLAARPGAISICHNDALVGDVYVNHGLLQAAMRARGHYVWRMARNPLHLFTAARDRIRYRGSYHRLIVALTGREASLLTETYSFVRPPIEVIPNGVDIERFRVPSAAERLSARGSLGLDADSWVAVFIGHEFDRKGLPLALDAVSRTPGVHLLVVGGTPRMIERARTTAERVGVADRVTFVGTRTDVISPLWAADALVLPSAYEANALVVLEALACGVPVIATAVGAAAEVITDGETGYIITRDVDDLADRLALLRAAPAQSLGTACRATAESRSWGAVSARYLEVIRRLRPGDAGRELARNDR